MNYTNRPLDIPTAVEYVTNMLLLQRGFFIMTDMGRIGIEGIIEKDPVNPVQVHRWKCSTTTEWKHFHHNEICDYYVQIGVHPNASYEYIRLLSIQAIMAVKLYHAVRYHVIQPYIDAATLSFIWENERDPEFYISRMEHEFVTLHYALKPNKIGVELSHYMMRERISKARSLIDKAEKQFIAKAGDSQFNCDILALIYDLRMSA